MLHVLTIFNETQDDLGQKEIVKDRQLYYFPMRAFFLLV